MNFDLMTELPVFLAYSLELEKESAERLREFSAMMKEHNQHELAGTFAVLASYSDDHAKEVEKICRNQSLPELKAWEFEWPDSEPPETCHYEGVAYSMTTREALEIMLDMERESAHFYADVADRTPNGAIRKLALEFAEEEQEHAQALDEWLHRLPVDDNRKADLDPPHQVD